VSTRAHTQTEENDLEDESTKKLREEAVEKDRD
jgi:hypothetical protein